jgi:hypothetical protein
MISTVTPGGDMLAAPSAVSICVRLAELLDELALGTAVKAEFGADPAISAGIRHVIEGAVQRVEPHRQVSRFQERRFGNGRAIALAVEARERTFDDLLDLLAKKRRFSAWLRGQTLNQELFDAFMWDMSAGSWIERLPSKSFRWAIFGGGAILAEVWARAVTGVEGMGFAAAMVVAGFDAFLVNRLSENWNPHQFINGPLANFVAA